MQIWVIEGKCLSVSKGDSVQGRERVLSFSHITVHLNHIVNASMGACLQMHKTFWYLVLKLDYLNQQLKNKKKCISGLPFFQILVILF